MSGNWYRSEYASDTTRKIYHLRDDGTEEYLGEVTRYELFKPVDPSLEITPALRKLLGEGTLFDRTTFVSNGEGVMEQDERGPENYEHPCHA